jgi:glycosyltransferase involved in cell wall biosynthesis
MPLNERVLESALGIVGLNEPICAGVRARDPDLPVLKLPHHLSLCLEPLPSRAEARRALGLPENAVLVTAPGLAMVSKRLDVAVRVVGQLRDRYPRLRLVVAGALDPNLPLADWSEQAGLGDSLIVTGHLPLDDFQRHLVAADVILALRFPCHGEISGALIRAMGVGRPCLVTAGTPSAEEFPEGVVVPVDPGRFEQSELRGLLETLLADPPLGERIGELARRHVRRHHDLESTVDRLAQFLLRLEAAKPQALERWQKSQPPAGSLLEYLSEEVRWSALELGLHGYPLGLGPLLAELAGHRD